MQGRHLQVVMLVLGLGLGLGQASAEVARLVIVDVGERGDAETIGLAARLLLQPLARLDLAQDVAQRLGPAGVAVPLHVAVERRQQVVVDR